MKKLNKTISGDLYVCKSKYFLFSNINFTELCSLSKDDFVVCCKKSLFEKKRQHEISVEVIHLYDLKRNKIIYSSRVSFNWSKVSGVLEQINI